VQRVEAAAEARTLAAHDAQLLVAMRVVVVPGWGWGWGWGWRVEGGGWRATGEGCGGWWVVGLADDDTHGPRNGRRWRPWRLWGAVEAVEAVEVAVEAGGRHACASRASPAPARGRAAG
jgi:hypothetical protein